MMSKRLGTVEEKSRGRGISSVFWRECGLGVQGDTGIQQEAGVLGYFIKVV